MMTSPRLFVIAVMIVVLQITCRISAEDKQMPFSQSEKSDADRLPFGKNQCFAKGGLGIVAKRVYAVLDSTKNELKLPDGKDWSGRTTNERECVFVLYGKVFPSNQLPKDFKLEESVIVSFEEEKVVFFAFRNLTGGFYARSGN